MTTATAIARNPSISGRYSRALTSDGMEDSISVHLGEKANRAPVGQSVRQRTEQPSCIGCELTDSILRSARYHCKFGISHFTAGGKRRGAAAIPLQVKLVLTKEGNAHCGCASRKSRL